MLEEQGTGMGCQQSLFVWKQISYPFSGASDEEPTCQCRSYKETWVRSLGVEDSLKKEMATHASILAWKSPGQRSLVGYSPQGHKELDVTEVT